MKIKLQNIGVRLGFTLVLQY